jgi:hypothetical protein
MYYANASAAPGIALILSEQLTNGLAAQLKNGRFECFVTPEQETVFSYLFFIVECIIV